MQKLKSVIKLLPLMVCLFIAFNTAYASQENCKVTATSKKIELTKEMFLSVFTNLSADAVKQYFSKNTKVYLNWDAPMSRNKLINRVNQLSKALKTIHYQYKGFTASKDTLAVRSLVTVILKNGDTQLRKQISIIKFKGNKICRLWELSIANNAKLEQFN